MKQIGQTVSKEIQGAGGEFSWGAGSEGKEEVKREGWQVLDPRGYDRPELGLVHGSKANA